MYDEFVSDSYHIDYALVMHVATVLQFITDLKHLISLKFNLKSV